MIHHFLIKTDINHLGGGLWAAQRGNDEERMEFPYKHSTLHVLSPTLRQTVSSHERRSNALMYSLCSLYVLCSQNAHVKCFCIYCTKSSRPRRGPNTRFETATKQNMLSLTVYPFIDNGSFISVFLSFYMWKV